MSILPLWWLSPVFHSALRDDSPLTLTLTASRLPCAQPSLSLLSASHSSHRYISLSSVSPPAFFATPPLSHSLDFWLSFHIAFSSYTNIRTTIVCHNASVHICPVCSAALLLSQHIQHHRCHTYSRAHRGLYQGTDRRRLRPLNQRQSKFQVQCITALRRRCLLQHGWSVFITVIV
jgi:hypothetical protein